MEENIYTDGQEATKSTPPPIPQITLESLGFLSTTAQWTKFLAVMGFISIGIMLVVGLVMGVFFSALHNSLTPINFPFPMYWFGLIYFILGAVYVFPVIFLNNFSNYISRAVAFRETELLTIALENIKKYFKFIGILTIVMIVLSLLFPIFAIFLMSSTISQIPQHMNINFPHN